jgi:predicted dehydrogenase
MKLAVVGLGFMGSTHLKALGKVPGAELAAVCSHDARKLEGDLSAVKGNLGGAGEQLDFRAVRKYREMDELLADPEIAAVDLCLPTDLHEAVTVAALRAGKHVLVEKPMALEGASASRMIAEAEKQGRVLMTAQVLRFLPEYLVLEQAVKRPDLGTVRGAAFRRRCAAPGWGGWLKDPARSGGGVFDLLIHDADMCLHLFGAPDWVAATGYTDADRGIDTLQAELFYASGAVVTVTGGWQHSSAFPFSMEYSVTLDGGTVEYSSAGRVPTLYGDGAEQILALPGNEYAGDGYAGEIGYFVECCVAGKQPERCPPRQSADAVKLMLRMLEARIGNGEKMKCQL